MVCDEHILTVVEEIVRAAGFRTKRRYVATSRGRRRGDLEIRDANVADKAHLIIDVAMVHEFHGACDDIGRHGALRHAQNPDRVLIDAAKREVLLPASVTRRCRVRPSLCTSDGGLLLLHAVKRRFREPGCTLCKTTSMRTGEDNRLALMPLLRLPFPPASDLLSICLELAVL